MDATKRFVYVLAAVMILVGCGGDDTDSANGAANSDMSDAAGGLDSTLSNLTGDATSSSLDVITKEFKKQLDTHETQLDAAKATAKSLADDQLNKLIGNLDSKIAEARTMLEKLTKADSGSAAALQKELTALIKKLPALHDEIKTKIKVLDG